MLKILYQPSSLVKPFGTLGRAVASSPKRHYGMHTPLGPIIILRAIKARVSFYRAIKVSFIKFFFLTSSFYTVCYPIRIMSVILERAQKAIIIIITKKYQKS